MNLLIEQLEAALDVDQTGGTIVHPEVQGIEIQNADINRLRPSSGAALKK